MALTPGTRLGVYEVTALLSEGGMGEVYRATDTNLKCQVAIKVLPASVAGDADRLARFQREAEVLAALNHPNIATIHGIERSGDMTRYVVVVDPGKNGEPHVKPLTPDGAEAFRLFNDKAAWGDFSQPSLYKSWKLACRAADVPFFNPYKLRHSYATALRAEGIDLADVQTLLGHKSAKTTARYAGVAPHKLTAAAAALQRAWHSVGSGEPDKSAGAAAQQTPERTDGEVASASHEASGQAKAWHRSVAPGKSSR